ncbi:MAG: AMP-binding protein, partial [Microthrixaceae bacterium]
RVRTFSAALCAAGIEPGDRVAIWAPNDPRWIVAALGIFSSGATLVPVNTRFKGAEARDVVDRGAAKLLVTVTESVAGDLLAELRSAGWVPGAAHHVVVMRGEVPPGATGWDGFCDGVGESDLAVADARRAGVTSDDVSDILFTSGTTGAPKGVVQTHGRTMRVASDWVAMVDLAEGERYLMVNPYFHMFGLKAGILASVCAGATMYPVAVFDADTVLRRVSGEAITVLPGAPTLYQSLLEHPGRGAHDLSSLRVAVTGAADIPVELIRRVSEELPFERIITGYGLTEAGTATATDPGDDPETVAATVGRPRPGFEVRIDSGGDGAADESVDAGGPTGIGKTDAGQTDVGQTDVGPTDVGRTDVGEVGEILLRGPSVMSHYLDDPQATAEALGDDGWLRTGDLGVIDAAGCVRILGRSKDMFIVGGFNAYPAEIENMLLEHPAITQVAVIGIPDERLGEVGMAFVVATGSSPGVVDEAALIEWSRGRMANYKAPRRIEFVDELPVNATGKVLKEDLRARFAAGS